MTIVKVDDLIDYMSGIRLNSDQQKSAQLILDGTQRALERWLGRRVEHVTDYAETLFPDYDGNVYPTYTPITGVKSVAALLNDGSTTYQPYTAWWANSDRNSIYTGIFAGLLVQAQLATVNVVYSGGIDGTQDPELQLAVMRVAAREVQNRHDNTVTVKDLGVRSQDAPLLIGWQPNELAELSRLKRRVSA